MPSDFSFFSFFFFAVQFAIQTRRRFPRVWFWIGAESNATLPNLFEMMTAAEAEEDAHWFFFHSEIVKYLKYFKVNFVQSRTMDLMVSWRLDFSWIESSLLLFDNRIPQDLQTISIKWQNHPIAIDSNQTEITGIIESILGRATLWPRDQEIKTQRGKREIYLARVRHCHR